MHDSFSQIRSALTASPFHARISLMADNLHFAASILVLGGALFLACSDDEGTSDAGVPDGGVVQMDALPATDSGVEVADAGFVDSGQTVADTGVSDAGVMITDIRIADVSAPIEVRFDQNGMLHLKCETNLDCFAAEGYFHAAHRFGQMDSRRRIARGRLSELFGFEPTGAIINIDRRVRRFLATRDGGRLEEVMWANSSDETKAMFSAYTRGVNAWIEDLRNQRNGARLTQEWTTIDLADIADWDVLDSVACSLPLMQGLTDNSRPEMVAGEIFMNMEGSKAFDLYGPRSATSATVLPVGITGKRDAKDSDSALMRKIWGQDISLRLMHAADALREAKEETLLGLGRYARDRGSNNWVVSPSQTAGDYALLANDPHLFFSNPAVWYLVHMDSTQGSGDLHVSGVSFAGLPGILIGQNAHLAWGMTTTFFDMADVYIEELNADGTGVIFEGQEVLFVEREETFLRKGLSPTTETFLYVPHHGPVVSMDLDAGVAVTVRWTGHDVDTDINFFLPMMKAENVDEARRAAENITSFGQSIVVADKAGSIAWFPYNRLPTRPWASDLVPPWLPLMGDGSAEWGEPVPYADLPQVIDPPAGYVATANGDMTGTLRDGDPTNEGTPWLQSFAAEGYRQARILELLEAQTGEHTPATMQAIQGDVYSLLAEENLPRILRAAESRQASLSAVAQTMLSALSAWQYQCPTGLNGVEPDSPADDDPDVTRESAGCTAFHVVWEHLTDATFRDDFQEVGLPYRPRRHALPVALTQPQTQAGGDVYWDDVSTAEVETSTDTIVAGLEAAAGWLSSNLGSTATDWRWGRIHTVTLFADFSDLLGARLNNGPFSKNGGMFTVDVAGPLGPNDYSFVGGASMRYVCEVSSAGPTCSNQIPGGQRHFTNSPNYDDLLQEWLINQSHPMPFTEAEVSEATVETLMVRAP